MSCQNRANLTLKLYYELSAARKLILKLYYELIKIMKYYYPVVAVVVVSVAVKSDSQKLLKRPRAQ